MPWMPLGVVQIFVEMQKEKDMANVDYDREDCEKQPGCGVPSMSAYAQMLQQPQQQPQSAQDMLNRQMNNQMMQAQEEAMLRAKHERMREMERAAMEVAQQIPVRKQGAVNNKCAIQKAPEPVAKKHVADELMDAMEYLIADIKGNVLRNKALRGIETNYAIRRAQDALVAARASVRR